jgi:hypothetical protein
MNVWTSRASLLVFLTAAACSGAPPAQPQSQAAPTDTPGAEQAPASEAISSADALLDDLKRREAAQAKFDKENPPPAVVPLPVSPISSGPAPPVASSPPPSTDAPTAALGALPDPAPPGRDQAWWKQQMQSLQASLDGELAKLAAAEKANWKYGYNDLQAMYKAQVAAVADARLAIDRLHDEARRAGVPPGWLR